MERPLHQAMIAIAERFDITFCGHVEVFFAELIQQKCRESKVFLGPFSGRGKWPLILKPWCKAVAMQSLADHCCSLLANFSGLKSVGHLIMPFMDDPREILLADVFGRSAQVHFTIDGLLSFCQSPGRSDRMNRLMWALVPDSIFARPAHRRPQVVSWRGMDALKVPGYPTAAVEGGEFMATCEGLQPLVNQVLESIARPYDGWVVLTPQNLFACRQIDALEEVGIYLKIIRWLHMHCDYGGVLIAPHPRRDPARVRLMRMLVDERVDGPVDFLEFHSADVPHLPLELIFAGLGCSGVAGLYSTCLMTLPAQLPDVQSHVFTDSRLPAHFVQLFQENRSCFTSVTPLHEI